MPRKPTHEDLEKLVAGLVTGGVDDADRERAREHVAACETCRASYVAYREIWLSLGGAAPRVLPPVALRQRVLKAQASVGKPVVRRAAAARAERAAVPERFAVLRQALDAFRFARPALAARRARVTLAVVLALLLPLGALIGIGVFAPSPALATATQLTIISGKVEVAGPDGVFALAEDGMLLAAGQRIRTGDDASAIVTFFDGSTFTVEGGTDVSLERVLADAGDGATAIEIFQLVGRTWSNVQKLVNPRSRYTVRTPSATAAVRGTAFATSVTFTAAGLVVTRLDTDDGAVEFTSENERVIVAKDQTSEAQQGQRPTPPKQETPKEQVGVQSNAPFLLVKDGKACGRTIEGGVVQIVQQLPRCVVSESGVVVKDAKPGEFQIVVRSEREQDVTVRAVGAVDGVEAFRHERTERVRDLVISRLTTERRPDGSLDAAPPTQFTPTDRVPARIGKPKPGEPGPVAPAVQPPQAPQREQPQPGTRPATDTEREGHRRPGAGELPRDVERAIDPEGTRGRPFPGADGSRDGPRTSPERPEQERQHPLQRPPRQTQPEAVPGLPRPSIELPRPPAPGPRQETQPSAPAGPDVPKGPPKQEGSKPEPGKPEQPKPQEQRPAPQPPTEPRVPEAPRVPQLPQLPVPGR